MASKEKTVIVTGVSQGIGAGVAQAFLNRGYNVVANSRNITKANPFLGRGRMLHWSKETSATRAPPQRSWILPYRGLAGSMC